MVSSKNPLALRPSRSNFAPCLNSRHIRQRPTPPKSWSRRINLSIATSARTRARRRKCCGNWGSPAWTGSLTRWSRRASACPNRWRCRRARVNSPRSMNCAPSPAKTGCIALSSAWAIRIASPRRSSSAICWKILAGTPNTPPTRPRFPRDAWKRCSISKP